MATTEPLPKSLHDDIADHADGYYRRQVERTAKRLREMVEDFERKALDIRPRLTSKQDDQPAYTDAVSRAQHSLMWGLANASTDGLIQAAADADYAFRAPYVEEGE